MKRFFSGQTLRMRTFHTVSLPLMHAEGRFTFRQDDTFVAVNLSYKSDGYELVVGTSKNEPSPAGELAAVSGWLGGQELVTSDGEIAMPRVSATGSRQQLPAIDAPTSLSARRKRPRCCDEF